MGPDEEASINLPPAVHVRTMKSTDEGVAFLVECGGKRIYHAGDLNNWVWSGEPEADNLCMSENYRLELEKMKGNHVDVAFVPLDPRQEAILPGHGRLYAHGGRGCGIPHAFLGRLYGDGQAETAGVLCGLPQQG